MLVLIQTGTDGELMGNSDDLHLMFEMDLMDAPGRAGSCHEYVSYVGNEKWRLDVLSSSFDGTEGEDPIEEQMTSEELVSYALEQDYENVPSYLIRETQYDDDGEVIVVLGPRASELLEIAKKVKSKYIIEALEERKRGE
jgi:hypothetical protein